MIKKMIAATLIATTMFTAIPAKKSEASVFFGWASERECVDGYYDEEMGLCIAGSTLTALTLAGGILLMSQGSFWALVGGAEIVILDAHTTNDAIREALAKRFPFLDDSSVLNALSEKITATYNDQHSSVVSLLADQIDPILDRSDLTPDERMQIVRALQ